MGLPIYTIYGDHGVKDASQTVTLWVRVQLPSDHPNYYQDVDQLGDRQSGGLEAAGAGPAILTICLTPK